jgi:hypothetical protein
MEIRSAIVASMFCCSPAFAASEIVNSFDLGGPYYHAGSIAVAAYPHWEAVVMGPIPAVLGSLKYGSNSGGQNQPGFKVVAIVEQDRPAHALMIAKTEYDEIAADPSTKLPGQKLLLTPRSSGQMYAERCLAGWQLSLDKLTVVGAEEAAIRKGLRDKEASVAFVWSSFTYLAENDAAKAKALDCQNDMDVEIPTFIVARSDLLNETDPQRLATNRRQIGTYVARFLGAWAAAKNKPEDAAKKLVTTYAVEGIKVTQAQALAELEARTPPNLADQQVKFTPVTGGVAPLATSLDVIIDFMVASGSLKINDRPVASTLLDRSILDFIAADAELGPVARGEK